jgi:hypothetical protein
MTISELILKLEEIRKDEGDLEVVRIEHFDYEWDYGDIDEVKVDTEYFESPKVKRVYL